MAGIGGTPTFAFGTMASGMPKKPTNPTALSAIANPDSSNRKRVSVSWTAPVNTGFPAVTSYNLEIVGVTTITGITGTSTTWSSGTINTNYQFKVYAVNSAGTSIASNTASATVTDVPDTTTVSVNNTTTFGSMILSWSAPSYTGSSAITGYTVSVDGVGNIYSGSGTSYTWTGGSKGSSYNFRIIASNSVGNSATSGAVASTVQGNVATGGSQSDVANYLSTGQTWRIHTFSGTSTLSVSVATTTFKVLAAGGGGAGGGPDQSRGGGGGGGGAVNTGTINLSVGNNTVAVGGNSGTSSIGSVSAAGGGAGGPGNTSSGGARNGGTSGNGNLGGFNSTDSWNGGGGGGAGGAGGNGRGSENAGGIGGAGVVNNITGSNITYGAGGQGGSLGNWGSSGQAGTVVVAYRLT